MNEQRSHSSDEMRSKSRWKRAGSFMAHHPHILIGGTAGGFAIEQGAMGDMRYIGLSAGIALISVVSEAKNIIIQTGRKNKEAPLGTLSTKGFQTSPNPTAEVLSAYTGISFITEPEKIVYTRNNQLIHLRKDPIQALDLRSNFKGNLIAKYETGYNILFASENSGIVDDFHENGHGLIRQTNPDIYTVQQEFIKSFIRERPRVDIEKPAVYSCFEEGMANWLSLFAAEKLYYDLRQSQVSPEHINLLLENMRKELPGELVDRIRDATGEHSLIVNGFFAPDEEDVSTLRNVIGIYEHAFSIQGRGIRFHLRNYKLHKEAEALLDSVEYDIGSHFVNEGIITLIDSGMNLTEALVTLIKNPPETVNDLINPERYVREKLLSGQNPE